MNEPMKKNASEALRMVKFVLFSASAGITCAVPGEKDTLDTFQEVADRRMYACKRQQKDQQSTEFFSAGQGREGKPYGI